MRNKLWILLLALMLTLAACGGGEEEEPAASDETSSAETADSNAGEEANDTAADETEETASEEPTEAPEPTEEPAPAAAFPLGAVVALEEAGFSVQPIDGFDIDQQTDEITMIAPDGNRDTGPYILVAGGPLLEGGTAEELASLFLGFLAEDEAGIQATDLVETTQNGYVSYTADLSGELEGTSFAGRFMLLSEGTQGVIVFGGAPVDEWNGGFADAYGSVLATVEITEIAIADAPAEESGLGGSDGGAAAAPIIVADAIDPSAAGMACLVGDDTGISCIMPDGSWQLFTEDNSGLPSDYILDTDVCPDGTILLATTGGNATFDGATFTELPEGFDSFSSDVIACSPTGDIWVGFFEGMAVLSGGSWTNFDALPIEGTEDPYGLVDAVEVGPDGTAWVMFSNSVASYDGSAWTTYAIAEFGDTYFFDSMTIGPDGQPRVSYGDGFFTFDGAGWVNTPDAPSFTNDAITVDSDGNIWLSTFDEGIYFYDGSWQPINTDLPSQNVNQVAQDGAGRVWIATDWGFGVLDGSTNAYRMDNSELGDNEVTDIVVIGAGPVLPAQTTDPTGTISGNLTLDGAPYADAVVQVCAEEVGFYFYGDTPCEGMAYYEETVTDADGNFVIEGVLEGYYTIIAEAGGEGEWAQLTGEFGFGAERVLVAGGEAVDVGELILESEE